MQIHHPLEFQLLVMQSCYLLQVYHLTLQLFLKVLNEDKKHLQDMPLYQVDALIKETFHDKLELASINHHK